MDDVKGGAATPQGSSPHKYEMKFTIQTAKEINHPDAIEFLEHLTQYLKGKFPKDK